MENKEVKNSPHVQLAEKTIKEYVKNKKVITPPSELPDELKIKAGVFVSLKKKGELRGCIGTIYPNQENVAKEIIANAVSAAIRDPRFFPVQEDELKDLTISVDVLHTPELITDIKELDAKKYGVIVYSQNKSGLLLPDLEGVDTPEEQIEIARRKAGINRREEFSIKKFTVERFY